MQEFNTGQKVTCTASFDGQQHPAEIIEKRVDEKSSVLYYVHYTDCDRRLDEWVESCKVAPWVAPRQPLGLNLHLLQNGGDIPASGDLNNIKVTRRLKRKYEEANFLPVDDKGDASHEADHHPLKVKNIKMVEFGRFEMDTWYYAPYPEPYASQEKLYICEYTLKYFRKKRTLLRHLAKVPVRHPPGDEIYRSPAPGATTVRGAAAEPSVSVFEVDGRKAKVFCQNLCLLSKLFLDHKTLYFDVEPFLFYVLCERDAQGHCHLVGYFSKEKHGVEDHNLACILTLPAYQRRGFGRLLIALAYEISRREGKIGTPERPLSDLGAVSFRSYWTRALLEQLRSMKGDIAVKEVSERTMIRTQDIVDTLQGLGLIKYWKGSHLVHADPKQIQELWAKFGGDRVQRGVELDPSYLHWQPLVPPTGGRKRTT